MQKALLSIGYGRQLFEPGNSERERLVACAHAVGGMHHIVFTMQSDSLESFTDGALHVYPTNSLFRIAMVLDAIMLGFRIIRSTSRNTSWCITTQDPLASGVVGFVLRLFTKFPLVVQEHADIFSADYWRSESWSHRIWYVVARMLVRRADRVRAVSVRVKRHLVAAGVLEERVVVLPVNPDSTHLQSSLIQHDLKRQFPDASIIVLSMLRFVPQKNIQLLLYGFRSLYAVDSRARLVLVGSGQLESFLKEEIRRQQLTSAVTILPWSSDVASLMKTADMYLLSSNYEGWGRVLIEAMALGLPAVTTDVGCVGEVFLHNVHGLVVPVGNEKAFADAVVLLGCDAGMRKRFKEAGPHDSASLNNSARYMQDWARIYAFGESQ